MRPPKLHVACSGSHLHLVHYLTLTRARGTARGRNCLDIALEANLRLHSQILWIGLHVHRLHLQLIWLCLILTVYFKASWEWLVLGAWWVCEGECGNGEEAEGMYHRWSLLVSGGNTMSGKRHLLMLLSKKKHWTDNTQNRLFIILRLL